MNWSTKLAHLKKLQIDHRYASNISFFLTNRYLKPKIQDPGNLTLFFFG